MTYDANGRVLTVGRPLSGSTGGPTTTFAYQGGRTRIADPNGGTSTYVYDYLGRITDSYDANGNAQSTSYDTNSNVVSFTPTTGLATGQSVTNSYSSDGKNNITSSQLPTGAKSTFAYASSTNAFAPSKVTDAQGASTAYTYDTKGNTAKTENVGEATSTSVTRNGDGTVATGTDAKGVVTKYGYDAKGELTTIDHPAPLGDEAFSYDALSRVATSTDGKGTKTTYTYDALDRVVSRTTGGLTVGYTYDVAGNRTKLTTAGSTDTSSYDRSNRVTSEDQAVGEDSTYTYDGVGNLTGLSTTRPSGGTVSWSYSYNAVNLVDSVTEPNGARTTFGYDEDNNRTRTTYPGGTVQDTIRDGSGRATRITAKNGSTVLTDLSYSFTKAGGGDSTLVQSRTDAVGIGAPAGAKTTYTHDGSSRLTKAAEATSGGALNASWAYSYDKAGNRTAQTLTGSTGSGTNPGTTSYTYNDVDQLTAINGSATELGYDGAGNETANPGNPALGVRRRAADYTTANQVASITIKDTSDQTTIPYSYSGYLNDARRTAGGTTFTRSTLGMTGTYASGQATAYTRDPSGQLVSMNMPDGTSQYYLTDNLGSVIALVDAAGNRTATYAYDPYGATRLATGAKANANPYRYTGGYRDADTGLYKLGVRYYDPTLGRFTQPDPTRQEENAYLYAEGDPCNRTDQGGACSTSDATEGVAAAGALAGTAEGTEAGLALAAGEAITGGTLTIVLGGAVGIAAGIAFTACALD